MENYSYIETRKVFSRLGFALTFSILSVNVVQLIVAGFMSAVDPNLLMTDWANFFLIAVSFYLIGFPLAYCMMKKIPVAVSQEKKRLTLWQLVEYGLISYAVMILLNFLTTFLLSFIELFKTESIVNPVQQVILTGAWQRSTSSKKASLSLIPFIIKAMFTLSIKSPHFLIHVII